SGFPHDMGGSLISSICPRCGNSVQFGIKGDKLLGVQMLLRNLVAIVWISCLLFSMVEFGLRGIMTVDGPGEQVRGLETTLSGAGIQRIGLRIDFGGCNCAFSQAKDLIDASYKWLWGKLCKNKYWQRVVIEAYDSIKHLLVEFFKGDTVQQQIILPTHSLRLIMGLSLETRSLHRRIR
ncbi:hypothetical protein GIB67_033464, partial [Kingdonia uniflora]